MGCEQGTSEVLRNYGGEALQIESITNDINDTYLLIVIHAHLMKQQWCVIQVVTPSFSLMKVKKLAKELVNILRPIREPRWTKVRSSDVSPTRSFIDPILFVKNTWGIRVLNDGSTCDNNMINKRNFRMENCVQCLGELVKHIRDILLIGKELLMLQGEPTDTEMTQERWESSQDLDLKLILTEAEPHCAPTKESQSIVICEPWGNAGFTARRKEIKFVIPLTHALDRNHGMGFATTNGYEIPKVDNETQILTYVPYGPHMFTENISGYKRQSLIISVKCKINTGKC